MPSQESTEGLSGTEPAGAIQSANELKAGDRVVYPKQGVCRILGFESKEIAGQVLEFVSMARVEDNATILVPLPKVSSIGLRKVADSTEVADVFELLASSFDDPELDWKVRHRTHGDLLTAGGVLGVAEVLKALQGLANLRPLPQKERERYDDAKHLLVAEIAVSLGVPEATAEDFIDFALLPPEGTVRPPAKPRKFAVLPPKPRQFPRGGRRPSEEFEEEEDLLLDEEEGALEETGDGLAAEEAPAELEAEPEVEEEERPAKRPAAKAPKAPAARKAKAPSAKKKAEGEAAEVKKTKAAPKKEKVEAAEAKKPKAAAAKKAKAGGEDVEKPKTAPAKKAKAETTKTAAAKTAKTAAEATGTAAAKTTKAATAKSPKAGAAEKPKASAAKAKATTEKATEAKPASKKK